MSGVSLFLMAQPAFAVKFANQFTEFELPPRWQCNLEGAEWVCQNSVEEKKREAIIVLAAKLKGDQDSLDQYLTYLKAPKSFNLPGKALKSEPKYARITTLNSQDWVDSLHLESEIPGFYTRYLATVKQDLGILITYSINKNKYQQYLDDFDTLVRTLKVFRKAGGINSASQGSIFQNTQIPGGVGAETVFPGAIQGGSDGQGPQAGQKSSKTTTYVILIGIAVAVFFLIKRRKDDAE